MSNFDDLALAVESFGSNNKVIFDDIGMPSITVGVPKMKYSDLIAGGTQETLPFWIVDGVEKDAIWVSKFQNVVLHDRAYSLPLRDPRASITFDQALAACRKKGAGWHLNQSGVFTALGLRCKKSGKIPHGNNNYGQDVSCPWEKGIQAAVDGSTGKTTRTLTGSGPVTWYDDFTTGGIADLNGNVWEWCSGLRLNAGEIQIIPYGNAMKADCDMSKTSREWKAIKPDGSLVEPGTAGTLKFNGSAAGNANETAASIGNPILDTKRDKPSYTGGETDAYYAYLYQPLESVAAASGVTVPQLVKALGLFPTDSNLNGDGLWVRNYGERLPFLGGGWNYGSGAGVFAMYLHGPRSHSGTDIGFRSAFVNL